MHAWIQEQSDEGWGLGSWQSSEGYWRSGTKKKKKINECYQGFCQNSGVPWCCQVMWQSHAVPGLASRHSALQRVGQTDRQLGGFGWLALLFGCPIWPQTHFKSLFFLMIDPAEDGTELEVFSLQESLCTGSIFFKKNQVHGLLYFLIVAASWLVNHSLLFLSFLFLLLCAWFIHCRENALCSVHTNKRLLKESSFTLFFLCVCLLSQCWSRLWAVCESEIHEVKRTRLVA